MDKLKSRLVLTSKPSLIKSKDVIIKNYEEATPDMITTGYIVYQHPSGGLIIGFFGGTRGFMFPKEAERLGSNIKYASFCIEVMQARHSSGHLPCSPVSVFRLCTTY